MNRLYLAALAQVMLVALVGFNMLLTQYQPRYISPSAQRESLTGHISSSFSAHL
jgi:hypothetical protein